MTILQVQEANAKATEKDADIHWRWTHVSHVWTWFKDNYIKFHSKQKNDLDIAYVET